VQITVLQAPDEPSVPIPTLSVKGLALLSLCMLLMAFLFRRRLGQL